MTSPIIQSHPVLVETLRLAVPLRLAELLALRDDERERVALEWASDGARLVAARAAAELPSLLDVDPDAGRDGEPTRRPIETVEIPGVSR